MADRIPSMPKIPVGNIKSVKMKVKLKPPKGMAGGKGKDMC